MTRPTIHLRTSTKLMAGWLYPAPGESTYMLAHLIGANACTSITGIPWGVQADSLPRFTRLAALHGWEVKVHDTANAIP